MQTESSTLILAVDNGSSSVRAGCYDENARPILPVAKVKRTFKPGSKGESELDPFTAVAQTKNTISRLLANFAIGATVRTVSFCAFWHSLCGLDEQDRPTTPILGWADTRARDYSQMLKDRFDEKAIHQRTGAHFHSSFWPAKLLWLREERPEIWRRTKRWVSFSDLCQEKLFGDARTSLSMASATGLLDQRTCVWDAELLDLLEVKEEQLPRIANSFDAIRPSAEAIGRWPQLRDAFIFPAIGDGAADTIGSGCRELGEAVLMVGTSASMRMTYRGAPPEDLPQGLWSYRIDRERVVVGGALSDGGNLLRMIRRKYRLSGDLDSELRKRKRDMRLRVEPYFFGERSTGYREDAKGEISGISAEHDGVDVLLSAMHSIAERIAEIAKRLETIAPIRSIYASGGTLGEFPVWREIFEQKLSHKIAASDTRESALKGTALLALERLGKIEL